MIDDSKVYALNTTVRGMTIRKILRFGDGIPPEEALEVLRARPENEGVPYAELLHRQQKFKGLRRTLYRVYGTQCGHESEMTHQGLRDRKYLDAEGHCARCVRGAILEELAAKARAKGSRGVPQKDSLEELVDKLWKPTSGRITYAD